MSRRRQCSTGHALPSRSQKQLHNTLPTGAILTVLILTFGPCRGAHFNPAVSVAFALRRQISWQIAGCYVGEQFIGGIIGVWAAHLMFELPLWPVSLHTRTGAGNGLRDSLRSSASYSRFLVVSNPAAVPYAVGLYITSAYWFTASTSFANPAVTIARSLSDTFAGITPAGSPEGANTSSADAFRAASRERAGAGLGCRQAAS